ncbi:hypothetical protein D3C73_1570650 [compost metagenome]
MTKGVLPIIGPRTPEQIADNLLAADIQLTPDQIERLDRASAISLGFPHEMLAAPGNIALWTAGKADRIDNPAWPVR